MKFTDTHVYFWNGEFSNWFPAKFELEEIEFSNTEQAFMYRKAQYFKDTETTKLIINEKNPKAVKMLGRQIKNYDDNAWSDVRVDAMICVNLHKFEQNSDLKKILFNTGNRILVEASPFDRIWGVGLGENDPLILDEENWLGQNLLGQALMVVREMIL